MASTCDLSCESAKLISTGSHTFAPLYQSQSNNNDNLFSLSPFRNLSIYLRAAPMYRSSTLLPSSSSSIALQHQCCTQFDIQHIAVIKWARDTTLMSTWLASNPSANLRFNSLAFSLHWGFWIRTKILVFVVGEGKLQNDNALHRESNGFPRFILRTFRLRGKREFSRHLFDWIAYNMLNEKHHKFTYKRIRGTWTSGRGHQLTDVPLDEWNIFGFPMSQYLDEPITRSRTSIYFIAPCLKHWLVNNQWLHRLGRICTLVCLYLFINSWVSVSSKFE